MSLYQAAYAEIMKGNNSKLAEVSCLYLCMIIYLHIHSPAIIALDEPFWAS